MNVVRERPIIKLMKVANEMGKSTAKSSPTSDKNQRHLIHMCNRSMARGLQHCAGDAYLWASIIVVANLFTLRRDISIISQDW